MIRLYTKSVYANQTLHLPFIGNVKLDSNASFACDDKIAELFVEAMRGSVEFYRDPKQANLNPKQVLAKAPGVIQKSPKQKFDDLLHEVGREQLLIWLEVSEPIAKEDIELAVVGVDSTTTKKQAKKEKIVQNKPVETVAPVVEEEESVINPDDIKEAISSSDDADELRSLVELIPGVKQEDTQGLDVDALKQFLIKKVEERTAKK